MVKLVMPGLVPGISKAVLRTARPGRHEWRSVYTRVRTVDEWMEKPK